MIKTIHTLWENRIKVQEKINKLRLHMLPVLEHIYCFMFVLLTAYNMLRFVPVEIVWADLGKEIPVLHFLVRNFLLEPNGVLAVIVVLCYLFSKEYDWRVIVAALIIGRCSFYAFERNRYSEMLTMILLMLGAKGFSFRKLVKIHFTTCLIVFACAVFSSQVGLIENMVYHIGGEQISFGFTYPTRFAAHVFYLLLWYWYLRGKSLTHIETVLPLIGSAFVSYFSGARASAISLLALFCVMQLQMFWFRRAEHKGEEYCMNRCFSLLLSFSMILGSIMITGMTMLYTPENSVLTALDNALSGRLYLCKKGMDLFGFRLWGRYIKMIGNGWALDGALEYFYIDSSFLQFVLQYGAIMTALILLLFWIGSLRAGKCHDWILLWVTAFAALHGLVEPHVLRLGYSPLIFAAFADMKDVGYELQFKMKWKRRK